MTSPFAARPSLAVVAAGAQDAASASAWAHRLHLPLVPAGTEPGTCRDFDILMVISPGGISLQQTHRLAARLAGGRQAKPGRRLAGGSLPGPVTVEFGSEGMRHRRRSGHNELLGRAVGVSPGRRLQVLDATAGLGRDSFILADLGCVVTLCEREPVIAAMLAQGLEAALAGGDEWLVAVAKRMSLYPGDGRTLAREHLGPLDVIYLDPMFPQRDKSAAVKKEMALFHALLGGDAAAQDADDLATWALQQDVARVVVKRPPRAPFLARLDPSHSLAGKAVRFDVYVRRALS